MVGLLALFAQQRNMLVFSLALWCGICGGAAVILRNYASYAAALSGITAAIVFADTVSDPTGAFLLAVVRVGEICIGIGATCLVMLVVKGPSAAAQLSLTLDKQAAQLWSGFSKTLESGTVGSSHTDLRHEIIRGFALLRNQVDAAIGETSYLRSRRGNLNHFLTKLLDALVAWRNLEHIAVTADTDADRERDRIFSIFRDLDPSSMRLAPLTYERECARARVAIASEQPRGPTSLITNDAAMEVVHCLEAMANCRSVLGTCGAPARQSSWAWPTIVDPLPVLIASARVFLAVLLTLTFWIESAWPVGYFAAVFAAVATLVFAAFGEQAFSKAREYSIGAGCMMTVGAMLYFGVLPALNSFPQLLLVLVVFYSVIGFLQAGKAYTTVFLAMSVCSLPMLGLANPTIYDASNYFNLSSAILVGSAVGTCFFAIIPALDPRTQERRLMERSIRDLHSSLSRPYSLRGKRELNALAARIYSLPSTSQDAPFSDLMAIFSAVKASETLQQELSSTPYSSDLARALRDAASGALSMALEELERIEQWVRSPRENLTDARRTRLRTQILLLKGFIEEHGYLLADRSLRNYETAQENV
jgi:uncharacterized membrane protein YccC